MSGWRVSADSAPGTTTDGPWSPPMASSAMRTLSGMDRTLADAWHRAAGSDVRRHRPVRRTGATITARPAADKPVLRRSSRFGTGHDLVAARPLFQRCQRGKGCAPDRSALGRLRIRRPACADRGRFRASGIRSRWRRDRRCRRPAVSGGSSSSIGDRRLRPRRRGRRAPARTRRSIASSTSFSIGSRVTTQFWPTVARHLACDMKPVAAVPGQVEDGRQPRQLAQAGDASASAARGRRPALEIDMQAGLRDIVDARPARSRAVPAVGHCRQSRSRSVSRSGYCRRIRKAQLAGGQRRRRPAPSSRVARPRI